MKPKLGVCYYPEQWPEDMWADDARKMVEAGLSWVRIGEFAWSRLEPQEGNFQWEWLDRAVEVLANAGLKIVMGTPSATPPYWMIKKFPDMLAHDDRERQRKFGSRRHYCFSHLPYRAAAAEMAARMAARYGKHPAVQAWQIDNEYACHDTTVSYSPAAKAGFRSWLEAKYKAIEALNDAWGNVFWSMEYSCFQEIDMPNMTVTEANPSHVLDFKRYSSDQVVGFNRAQVDAVRAHVDTPLIHNYMGRTTDFDHFETGHDLDIASWDSYPIGFLEDRQDAPEGWKLRFTQQGDPDFQAFHHDLYRAVGKGRWWVMEQQPGPVNWAPWNPIPLKGMVRLWSWEAFAHGAEVVSYFRWRQARSAQEQKHAGLYRPDNEEAQGLYEAKQVAAELEKLGEVTHQDSPVGLVFDYESAWAWETQPQGQDFDYFQLVFDHYRILRRLGLSVDILPPNCEDFGDRKLVVIPGLMRWNDNILKAINSFDGMVIAGPRTGSKDDHMAITLPLPPNMPGVDVTVSRVASMRPTTKVELPGKGHVQKWLEELEGGPVLETTKEGAPLVVGSDKRLYVGGWLDYAGMLEFFRKYCQEAGLEIHDMPEGLRLRQLGDKRILINYSTEPRQFGGWDANEGGSANSDQPVVAVPGIDIYILG